MRVEVKLPAWGMGQSEAVLSAWQVAVGDNVTEGQVIAVVETAKVDGEVEAPATGVIAELVVPEDETVDVGTVIAVIETAD